jgi:hypothetical protein
MKKHGHAGIPRQSRVSNAFGVSETGIPSHHSKLNPKTQKSPTLHFDLFKESSDAKKLERTDQIQERLIWH